jgi:hypothetical protein
VKNNRGRAVQLALAHALGRHPIGRVHFIFTQQRANFGQRAYAYASISYVRPRLIRSGHGRGMDMASGRRTHPHAAALGHPPHNKHHPAVVCERAYVLVSPIQTLQPSAGSVPLSLWPPPRRTPSIARARQERHRHEHAAAVNFTPVPDSSRLTQLARQGSARAAIRPRYP